MISAVARLSVVAPLLMLLAACQTAGLGDNAAFVQRSLAPVGAPRLASGAVIRIGYNAQYAALEPAVGKVEVASAGAVR